jgi:hypothetical protein
VRVVILAFWFFAAVFFKVSGPAAVGNEPFIVPAVGLAPEHILLERELLSNRLWIYAIRT